ncbi:substrate-binding periplasmic protein [Spirochaeta isovalerica]|uniref:ABC-type amino acid transport substrate-binding protein n=1 Tax=Spirochaeta isovalerica TaxID=150 RepID=A0A841R9L4_9SPIO|nr:transporter substrate-binding domain-containing protein [Spirochaeta isovalerica]MBB6480593.1 ABC-type amino acid transport substrate-binding protein [Spirochaeta isovalerica]
MYKFSLSPILLFTFLFPVLSLSTETLYTEYQEASPKYFRDKGNTIGICVDIIHAINAGLSGTSELSIEPVNPESPFVPFKRIQENLKEGRIQIFIGLAKTDDREDEFDYIETPLYKVRSTFAIPAGSGFIYRNADSLTNLNIAVLRGSKTAEQMSNLTENLIYANSLDQAVTLLDYGRADLLFYHSLGLGYLIKSRGLSDRLTISGTAYEEYEHYIALNPSVSQDIKEKIEKVLIELINTGTIDRILNKYL